jgi:hypothetical protein
MAMGTMVILRGEGGNLKVRKVYLLFFMREMSQITFVYRRIFMGLKTNIKNLEDKVQVIES